jgi:hypothetical protein
MDQNVVSGFERCLLKCVECSDEDFRYPTRFRPFEVRWNRSYCVLVRRHEFGLSSTADDTHHAIAFVPALNVRA